MITSIRIDFRGPERRVIHTASFSDQDKASNLLKSVLIDDRYDPKGSYALEVWDTSTGKDESIHIYMLAAIPPHTAAAFTTIAQLQVSI